jgi:hypothetical protein
MPDFGTLIFTVPLPNESGEQDYLNYYDSGLYEDLTTPGEFPTYPYSAYTESYTGITYLAVGGSRISEKKKYGVNEYDDSTFTYGTTTEGVNWTGYTFTYPITGKTIPTEETLYYVDYVDGYTMITGRTDGFIKEEVLDKLLTRNEHFLGFVDEPRVYSDIFVERGKQGVMELNLRLGEVDNMGELSNYGNGYFKVRKQ